MFLKQKPEILPQMYFVASSIRDRVEFVIQKFILHYNTEFASYFGSVHARTDNLSSVRRSFAQTAQSIKGKQKRASYKSVKQQSRWNRC